MDNWTYKLELIKARKIQRRLDAEDESTTKPKKKNSTGNPRLPFGLCKKFGIDIGEGWTPKDAWKALEGIGVSKASVYKHLESGKDVSSFKSNVSPAIVKMKNNIHWQHAFDRAKTKVGNLYPRSKEYGTGINYKGKKIPIKLQSKAFQELYNKIATDDGHMEIDELLGTREVKAMDGIAARCTHILGHTNKINNKGRKELRRVVSSTYMSRGCARKGENGNYVYDGEVKKEFKACLFFGLPGCGKSTLTDPWSEDNGAFISDSDAIKELLPEFQATGGLAAGAVHSESKEIHDKALDAFFEGGSRQGDNIAIPILGASTVRNQQMIKKLEDAGYDVEIRFAEGDAKKSLNRIVARGIETGRILKSNLVSNTGNLPSVNYHSYADKTNSKGKKYIRD